MFEYSVRLRKINPMKIKKLKIVQQRDIVIYNIFHVKELQFKVYKTNPCRDRFRKII